MLISLNVYWHSKKKEDEEEEEDEESGIIYIIVLHFKFQDKND